MNKRVVQVLQDGATTGNGTVVGSALTVGLTDHSFYVIGSAGVSAGAVTLETAEHEEYAGTWDALGTAVTVVASTTDRLTVSGAPLLAVRARVSTTVADGTVRVVYVGTA